MGNLHGRIHNERRQGAPLPASLQADLAAILAECLVAELREDDVARVQNVEKPTVACPGGTDRRKGKGVEGEYAVTTE